MPIPPGADALAPSFTHDHLEVVLCSAEPGTLAGPAVLFGALAVGLGGMVGVESVVLGIGAALTLTLVTAPALGVLMLRAAPTHLALTPSALVLERELAGRRVRRRVVPLGAVRAAARGRGAVPQVPGVTQPGL
ncbi:MAG: hypothetical protein ABMA64_18375, partial [Myxococcota bacterium]